jgi:hypothetical protein
VSEQPEPDVVAQGDQRAAELRGVLAPMLGAYFAGLIASGFERHEAMTLVSEYHEMLLENYYRGQGDAA